MASADALIACWNDKAYWNVWRPQTAIREAANDGNPLTTSDPNRLPFFASPGYPDHPSGYNCYTRRPVVQRPVYFGTDKSGFSLTSPGVPANAAVPPGNPVGVPGSTRTYTRFRT